MENSAHRYSGSYLRTILSMFPDNTEGTATTKAINFSGYNWGLESWSRLRSHVTILTLKKLLVWAPILIHNQQIQLHIQNPNWNSSTCYPAVKPFPYSSDRQESFFGFCFFFLIIKTKNILISLDIFKARMTSFAFLSSVPRLLTYVD